MRRIQSVWSEHGAYRMQQAIAGLTLSFAMKVGPCRRCPRAACTPCERDCSLSGCGCDTPSRVSARCVQVLALWLLRRKQPRVCRLVELFCLAVPAGDALCRWQVPVFARHA